MFNWGIIMLVEARQIGTAWRRGGLSTQGGAAFFSCPRPSLPSGRRGVAPLVSCGRDGGVVAHFPFRGRWLFLVSSCHPAAPGRDAGDTRTGSLTDSSVTQEQGLTIGGAASGEVPPRPLSVGHNQETPSTARCERTAED